MRPATYHIIRYVPDTARNEPVNIGLIAACASSVVLRFDPNALERVHRLKGELAPDALQMVTDAFIEEASSLDRTDEAALDTFIRSTFRSPFLASESRYLGIEDVPDRSVQAVLDNEVDRLLLRLVRPVRRHRQAGTVRSPKEVLLAKYRTFLHADQLMRDYEITHTATGVPRKVDAFLNHSADTAIDFSDLRTDATRDTVIEYTDAAKAKSQDILSASEVKQYILHLPTDVRKGLVDYIPLVTKLLKNEPRITVTTTADENERLVRELAESR